MDKDVVCKLIRNIAKKEGFNVEPELMGVNFKQGDNQFKLWMAWDKAMLSGNNLSVELNPNNIENVEFDNSEIYGKSLIVTLIDGQTVRVWL